MNHAFHENQDETGRYWLVGPITEDLAEMQMQTPPLNPFRAAETAVMGGGSPRRFAPNQEPAPPRPRGNDIQSDAEQYADGFDLPDENDLPQDGGIGGDLGNMGSDLGADDNMDMGGPIGAGAGVGTGLGSPAGAVGGPVRAGINGGLGRNVQRRPGRLGESVAMETHEMGMCGGDDSGDELGSSLPADKTSQGMDEVGHDPKIPDSYESKHQEPDDGITDEMGGMGKELGQNEKIKNKLTGGAGSMKENIETMAKTARRSIEEALRQYGRQGNYRLRFRVESESLGQARTSTNLTESLLDMEEFVTAMGHDAAKMFVLLVDSNDRIAHKAQISVGKIKQRGPILSENRVVFRSPGVARVFAEEVARAGAKCQVSDHHWGAKVTGRFNWNQANAAYRNIPSLLG